MAKPFKVKRISSDDRAEAAAVRILRTRVREFYSHWPDPDELPSEEQLHNQRISGKRLRYSAEMVRDLYPDRLALVIDLLKRQQDLLGSIQDVVTQRSMIAADLARRRRISAGRSQIVALESMLASYADRYASLFAELVDIWRGLTQKQLRAALKRLVSRPANRPENPPDGEPPTLTPAKAPSD